MRLRDPGLRIVLVIVFALGVMLAAALGLVSLDSGPGELLYPLHELLYGGPPPSADLICGACQRVFEGGPRRAAGTEDLMGAGARAALPDRVAAAARQFAQWLTARAGRGTREDLVRPGRWAREAEDNLWQFLEEPDVTEGEVRVAVCGQLLTLVSAGSSSHWSRSSRMSRGDRCATSARGTCWGAARREGPPGERPGALGGVDSGLPRAPVVA
jgi:hypothetical protein